MEEAGVSLLLSPEKMIQLSLVGSLENLGKLRALYRLRKKILRAVEQEKPRVAILVDYPGFNLNLSKLLKKLNIPLIYYSPPQVWLWGAWRIRKLKKRFEKLLVFFPFEEEFYQKAGLDAQWVGHPIYDWTFNRSGGNIDDVDNIEEGKDRIALLPGSRFGTIGRHLPPMLEAARILHQKNQKRRFLIPLAPLIPEEFIDSQLGDTRAYVKVVQAPTRKVLKASRCAMVGVGTAVLEAAFCGTPMVTCGKFSWPTAVIARLLRIQPQVLANRLAGKTIAPELWQREVTGKRLANEIESILEDPVQFEKRSAELNQIKETFENKGNASLRAAGIIQTFINGSPDKNLRD